MRRLELEFLVPLIRYVSRIKQLQIFNYFGEESKLEVEILSLELDALMLSGQVRL
jgi:hypothetical protein